MIFAAFRVPHYHVGAAQLGQHRGGHFAGVGTVVVSGDVLSAILNFHVVAVDGGLHRTNVGKRRNDCHLYFAKVVTMILQIKVQLIDQLNCLEVVEVHLPVACHQGNTCHA